jgi:hypothetical protein
VVGSVTAIKSASSTHPYSEPRHRFQLAAASRHVDELEVPASRRRLQRSPVRDAWGKNGPHRLLRSGSVTARQLHLKVGGCRRIDQHGTTRTLGQGNRTVACGTTTATARKPPDVDCAQLFAATSAGREVSPFAAQPTLGYDAGSIPRQQRSLQMTAKKIHLALQGGGAKFFCLVAALSELQELERLRRIEVVSVAGTSAGAIAGALYAMRVPMLDVYDWLRDTARASLLNKISLRFKLAKIVLGIPLIPPDLLESVLSDLFSLAGKDRPTSLVDLKIGDFTVEANRIPFRSFYTDLENNALMEHEPKVFLRTALRESAGLPFVFRTYRSVILDGSTVESARTCRLPSFLTTTTFL